MADPSKKERRKIGWAIFLAVTTIVFFGVAVALVSWSAVEPTFKVTWDSGGDDLEHKNMPIQFWHDEQRDLLIHRGKIDKDQRTTLLALGSKLSGDAKDTYPQSINELTLLSNSQVPLWLMMLITAIGGVIGVQARSVSYFILHACVKNDLNLKRWWAWYGLRPLLGMIFGPVVVLMMIAGLLPMPKEVPHADTLTMFILSILVGMVANMIFDKLVEMAQTMFGLNPDDARPQPPETTPDPVEAEGEWNAETNEAVITWTESSDPNRDHYEVRMTPGDTYDPENHTVVANNLQRGTVEFRTTAGLANAGETASFKVYVILTTAKESGSNTVTITRP